MVRHNDKTIYKKGALKECIQSYFLHGSTFCFGIYMPVSKPSICFWKLVISVKWRNKLLVYNFNLTGHRKSACCLQLLVFPEVWVIAPFWHCRTQVFPWVAATIVSKRFVKLGIKVYFWTLRKIWSKDGSYIISVYYLPIL